MPKPYNFIPIRTKEMSKKSFIKLLSDLEENLIELADYRHEFPEVDIDSALRVYGVSSAAKDAGL